MKTLLILILFALLFGALGIFAFLGFAIANWGDILLLVLVYIFRDQIKAGVEYLTGASQ